VAYESLILGFFTIWRGDPNLINLKGDKNRPKINEIVMGYRRDGFHWYRPCRQAFLGVSEDPLAWNWGNVQSVGGGCLVVGDRLFFYVSGRSANQKVNSTGLAFLRRDGFASMDAGCREGELLTRPLRFSGKNLFVNVNAPHGELRVEVLDEKGNLFSRFAANRCSPIRENSTLCEVRWQDVTDLSALANQSVRFRFLLRNGRLYSFWVSPGADGASYGYVAVGGPGFHEAKETAGREALREGCKILDALGISGALAEK
jgi:hypothetical protein